MKGNATCLEIVEAMSKSNPKIYPCHSQRCGRNEAYRLMGTRKLAEASAKAVVQKETLTDHASVSAAIQYSVNLLQVRVKMCMRL